MRESWEAGQAFRGVAELLQIAVPHAVELIAKRPNEESGIVAVLLHLSRQG